MRHRPDGLVVASAMLATIAIACNRAGMPSGNVSRSPLPSAPVATHAQTCEVVARALSSVAPDFERRSTLTSREVSPDPDIGFAPKECAWKLAHSVFFASVVTDDGLRSAHQSQSATEYCTVDIATERGPRFPIGSASAFREGPSLFVYARDFCLSFSVRNPPVPDMERRVAQRAVELYVGGSPGPS